MRSRLGAWAAISALVGSTAIAAPAAAAPEKVRAAWDFVDSIGVCTHWSYGDTPYGQKPTEVAQLLYDSGIRHVRDGIHPKEYDLADHGVHTTALVDLYLQGTTMTEFVADLHAFQAATPRARSTRSRARTSRRASGRSSTPTATRARASGPGLSSSRRISTRLRRPTTRSGSSPSWGSRSARR